MVLTLARNPVFGEVWRAICRVRGDPRRDSLAALMSRTVEALKKPEDKAELKTFIEMSYDQTGEVEKMIEEAPPGGPILRLEIAKKFDRQELLEIGRSCNYAVLAKVSSLLTGLVIFENPEGNDKKQGGIPMSSPDLFALLPHLMCPGTIFSRRVAAILAIQAVTTGSILAARGGWGFSSARIFFSRYSNLSFFKCLRAHARM